MNGDIQLGRVETERFSMEYMAFGKGMRPLVIIPGMSLRPVLLQAEAIAAAYKSAAEDHRVFLFEGTSNMPEGYSVRDMARDTAEAMKKIGIREADVFGASQGGMIAQCVAAEHPELVRRAVLGSTLSRPNPLSMAVFNEWIGLCLAGDPVALNRSCVEKMYSPAVRKAAEKRFTAAEKEGTPAEMHRFSILCAASRDFDFYEELSRIQCPVLVLGAEEDRVLGAVGSTEIAEKLGCESYIYKGCGHAVYDEAPDYLNRMLNYFRAEI